VPFTGSHPAAVLPLLRPLRRLGVPASAPVIGSLAPDLPFYVMVTSITEQTHSLAGVFSIDIAIGAVAFAAWRLLGRPATDVLLPGLRGAAPETGDDVRTPSWWRRSLSVALGLAVGGLTHVIWDSFTHAGMWGVDRLPWLADRYGPLPGYEWAQYASSVAGLVVLAGWWARSRRPVVLSRRAVRAWAMVAGAALAGAALGVWTGIDSEADPLRGALFLAATRGGFAGLLAVAAIGAAAAARPAAPLTDEARVADRNSPSAR
jgi:uncharacterized protein DUF4184